jgi:hypothetical protein
VARKLADYRGRWMAKLLVRVGTYPDISKKLIYCNIAKQCTANILYPSKNKNCMSLDRIFYFRLAKILVSILSILLDKKPVFDHILKISKFVSVILGRTKSSKPMLTLLSL